MVYKIPNKRYKIPIREISNTWLYKIPNKRQRIPIREISNTWNTRYQINFREYPSEKLVTHGIQDTQ